MGETRSIILRAMLENPNITVTGLAKVLDMSTTAVEKNIQHNPARWADDENNDLTT